MRSENASRRRGESRESCSVERLAGRAVKIMIVAGEASGDEHAAAVLREIRRLLPDAQAFGMGSAGLKDAGMELIVDAKEAASVMGLTEVFSSLHRLYGAFRSLLRAAEERRPDLAVVVDFPDFNLRLAKRLQAKKIPVVYFISPQIWAWRRGRIHQIRKFIRKVIPIFPFEESFYQEHGVDAEYLGHPFLDKPPLTVSRDQVLKSWNLDPDRPVIALLPGSRKAEVERLLPPMLEAYQLHRQARPGTQAVIPAAPGVDLAWLYKQVEGIGDLAVVPGQCREALSTASVAVVASGTATLETALAAVPFVVVYRLSNFTFRLGKLLVRGVNHIAMPNLIGGKKIVEELLQDEANGRRIAEELEKIIGDPSRYKSIKEELLGLRGKLQLHNSDGQAVAARVAKAALAVVAG